jgi:hypothetical protein
MNMGKERSTNKISSLPGGKYEQNGQIVVFFGFFSKKTTQLFNNSNPAPNKMKTMFNY